MRCHAVNTGYLATSFNKVGGTRGGGAEFSILLVGYTPHISAISLHC